MWRNRICLLLSWFAGERFLSSRALSSFFGNHHHAGTTPLGMAPLPDMTTTHHPPTQQRTIPRYQHTSKPADCVVVDCQCGRVRLTVPQADIRVDPLPKTPPPLGMTETTTKPPTYHAVVDCHCPQCRKYHVADRATYLRVPRDKVQCTLYTIRSTSSTTAGEVPSSSSLTLPWSEIIQECSSLSTSHLHTAVADAVTTFADACHQVGDVMRFQCTHCRTKLATMTMSIADGNADQEAEPPQLYLNLAAARDDSLPRKWTKQWRTFRFPWHYNQQAVWTRATAEGDYPQEDRHHSHRTTGSDAAVMVTGSCACQKYRYEIRYPTRAVALTELQHCYCQLCRRLSGGPFQTWLPVSRPYFTWLPSTMTIEGTSVVGEHQHHASHEPPIHRYTDHGRRHVCDSCGGVLTILYDSDGDEVIWPAAGGLDDATLPGTKELMSKQLYGICHISCRYRQSWYALPNDGYPHIKEAS